MREAPVAGMRQAMLRREHDIHVLSVVDAPASGELRTWTGLESRIGHAIGGSGGDARIGSTVILQARLGAAPPVTPAPPEAALDEAALRADVAAAASSGGEPGTVVEVIGLGRFAVWEVTDRGPTADAWNTRADRRIAAVAPADRDAELSAWTWNRGDAELTPFARYLLHMAKVRYELRLWSTASDRARSISVFSDQLLQRGQQRRQERFNLALTGVLGAIIMILTAVQALQYKPPLPAPVVPALIAALGALALLMSFIVVRAAVPGQRRWTAVLVGVGAVLLGAATGWTIAALVAGDVGPGAGVIWLAAGAGVIVSGGGTLLAVRRSSLSS